MYSISNTELTLTFSCVVLWLLGYALYFLFERLAFSLVYIQCVCVAYIPSMTLQKHDTPLAAIWQLRERECARLRACIHVIRARGKGRAMIKVLVTLQLLFTSVPGDTVHPCNPSERTCRGEKKAERASLHLYPSRGRMPIVDSTEGASAFLNPDWCCI